MGCHNDIIFITVPRIYFEVCNGFAIINIRETFDLKNKLDKFIKLTYQHSPFFILLHFHFCKVRLFSDKAIQHGVFAGECSFQSKRSQSFCLCNRFGNLQLFLHRDHYFRSQGGCSFRLEALLQGILHIRRAFRAIMFNNLLCRILARYNFFAMSLFLFCLCLHCSSLIRKCKKVCKFFITCTLF